LPQDLAGFTPAQVAAYDSAWETCKGPLTPGWSSDDAVRSTLTQCLAHQVGVPVDDTDLTTFVTWAARTLDAGGH
jgi:hypothetical protein